MSQWFTDLNASPGEHTSQIQHLSLQKHYANLFPQRKRQQATWILLDYSHLINNVFFNLQNFYLEGCSDGYHNTVISSNLLRFQTQKHQFKHTHKQPNQTKPNTQETACSDCINHAYLQFDISRGKHIYFDENHRVVGLHSRRQGDGTFFLLILFLLAVRV